MHKALRSLTMTGLGLLAGVTLSMGPAQAAPATAPATGTASAAAQQAHRFDDEVLGFYRNPVNCVRAGRVGERYGAWTGYGCSRVRVGFHRGTYALIVNRNHWRHGWNARWHQGTWPHGWSNRPQWPGRGHWTNGTAR